MNEHINQMLDTPVLDRLWDAHDNNITLCSLIATNIIKTATHQHITEQTHY
jgi:hypothetical protein